MPKSRGQILKSRTKIALRNVAEAQKVMAIYKETNGRKVRSLAELDQWMASPEGQVALTPHIDPADGTLVTDRRKFNRVHRAS
jgi:hypothetical protein